MRYVDWGAVFSGVVIGLMVTLLFLAGVKSGESKGWTKGYNQAFDDQKKWDCEFEYSNTPYSEIAGDCIKYFEKTK